jgi:hypothetical protein
MTSRTTVHHSPRVRIAATGLLIAAGSTGVAGQTGAVSAPAGPRTPAPCRVDFGGPQTPFTEETAARGIGYTVGNVSTGFGFYAMGGPSFIDLDLDGDPDIVCVPARSTGGSRSTRTTARATSSTARPGPRHLRALGLRRRRRDYDGDEDLDLFISCYRANDLLLRNDGGFQFTDVTPQAGVAGNHRDGRRARLRRCQRRRPARPLRRQPHRLQHPGAGADHRAQPAVHQPGRRHVRRHVHHLGADHRRRADARRCPSSTSTSTATPISTRATTRASFCNQHRNELYENVGGTFVNITDAVGTESCTDTMGIAIGDFDGNGWPDIYCTHIAAGAGQHAADEQRRRHLHRVRRRVRCQSSRPSPGAPRSSTTTTTATTASTSATSRSPTASTTTRAAPAVDIGPEMGVHLDGRSYNVAKADIDGDGDLDLLIERPGPAQALRQPRGAEAELDHAQDLGRGARPPRPARPCPGPHRATTGSPRRSSRAATAYRTQNSMDRHFGLGDACGPTRSSSPGPTARPAPSPGTPPTPATRSSPSACSATRDRDGAVTTPELLGLIDAFGTVSPESAIFDLDGNGTIDVRDFRSAIVRAKTRAGK